jgi:transposase-like protein
MKTITKETYQELYQKWHGSGLSMSSFAAQEGISRTTFYYWCNKFTKIKTNREAKASFSLISPAASSNESLVRITYPTGVSIEFFSPIDPDIIKKLL